MELSVSRIQGHARPFCSAKSHSTPEFCQVLLSSSVHLGGKDEPTLRSVIAPRSQNDSFVESNCQKLIQKGAAFLCSSYSSKPVTFAVLNLWSEGFAQYEFGRVHCAALSYYPCKFAEDCASRRIQVKDTVDQGHINAAILNG